jgi:hypothetical protein
MDPGTPEVERAFQLARSSACWSVSDIRKRLMAEGYTGAQLSGPYLHRQLRVIMRDKAARAAPLRPSNPQS